MMPLKFFTPSQSVYQLALRFLKIAEKDRHTLKRGDKASFHKGNFDFKDEVVIDSAKLQMNEELMDAFRLGMHLATISISSQLLEDLANNKRFVQSIGQLVIIEHSLGDLTEESEDRFDRLSELQHQLKKIQIDLSSSYPFQLLLDLAEQSMQETNKEVFINE